MTDKTELTREEVEALLIGLPPAPFCTDARYPGNVYCDDDAGTIIADCGPFKLVFHNYDHDRVAGLFAAAPTLARQLLATMDDRDRHLNNLGRFVSQVAMALGLPATSAPEVVLRQAAVTFDGAHRYADERDRLQADNARLWDELAEARATLAAQMGDPAGAPSDGWVYEVADNRDEDNEWVKTVGRFTARVTGGHWTIRPTLWDHDGDEDREWPEGWEDSRPERDTMRAADAALLATTEPPDAD